MKDYSHKNTGGWEPKGSQEGANMKYKVYMVWSNYEGKEQSRDLIASFVSEVWAKHFIETAGDEYQDNKFCKLIIES